MNLTIDEDRSRLIGKQVRRLGGLKFPPQTPEGWRELVRVLERHCETLDHVERVIDRWLDTEDECPTPAQLTILIRDVPEERELDNPVLAEPCPRCGPEGLWVSVERLNRNGEAILGIGRCNCARGRQLAAVDSLRQQKSLRSAS